MSSVTTVQRGLDPDQARRAASELRASTVRLAPDAWPDPLLFGSVPGGVVWQRGGEILAGRGEALRVQLPGGLAEPGTPARLAALLASIDADDEVRGPGSGAVLLGALPFDRHEPAEVVIPQLVVGRNPDGACWVTSVRPSSEPATVASFDPEAPSDPEEPSGRSPDQFSLTASLSHEEWCRRVAATVAQIDEGRVDKVVLARRVDVRANRPFVLREVLSRLAALYPSCALFSLDGFIGASPELLIERRGDRLVSRPLAGTVARSGDEEIDRELVDALLASRKNRHEHGFVPEGLREALVGVCTQLDVPDTPAVIGLRNVSHLATLITGRLRPGPGTSALELVARVHPTPALAGTPTDTALELLRQADGFDRGRFGGPVGWMDARGDGAWAVGIRCAQVDGAVARLYAGVGLVRGSDPEAELTETQLKLQALLAALVRP